MACKIPSPSVTVQMLLNAILCAIRGFVTSAASGGSTEGGSTLSVFDSASAPALNAEAVTPNDSTTWPVAECRSIWVSGAGDLVVTMANGDVTFPDVPAGTWLPIRPTKVKAASTATGIRRVW